ncbi:hypothetical protein [Paenibacillus peoriae]|uniref:hypothetical protein n=1 Tax=Paenibacillus peoriae TaxID=59893 RepID=UPI0015C3C035
MPFSPYLTPGSNLSAADLVGNNYVVKKILNRGKVESLSIEHEVSDVRYPLLIRLVSLKLPVQMIARNNVGYFLAIVVRCYVPY